MLPDDSAAIIGSPGRLFRINIIATVLDLVAEAWKSVRKRSDIDNSSNEDTIAGALYQELWEEWKKRGMDGPPRIENEVASRSSSSRLLPEGFIDFRFVYHWGEQDFFGMECKKVSSTGRTGKYLAEEYVNEGVMRFVTGKYCSGHDVAAMLGFVVDSNIAGSVGLVQSVLFNKQYVAKQSGQWNISKLFGNHSNLYETTHQQYGQAFHMTILHLFQEL